MKKYNYLIKDTKKLSTLRKINNISTIFVIMFYVVMFCSVGVCFLADSAIDIYSIVWSSLILILSAVILSLAFASNTLFKKYRKAQVLDENNDLDKHYINALSNLDQVKQAYKKKLLISNIILGVSFIGMVVAECFNQDPENLSIYTSLIFMVFIFAVLFEILFISNRYNNFLRLSNADIDAIEHSLIGNDTLDKKTKQYITSHSVSEQQLLLRSVGYIYSKENATKINKHTIRTMLLSMVLAIIVSFMLTIESPDINLILAISYAVFMLCFIVIIGIQDYFVSKIQRQQLEEYNEDKIANGYNIILLSLQTKYKRILTNISYALGASFLIIVPIIIWFVPTMFCSLVVILSTILWATTIVVSLIVLSKKQNTDARPYVVEYETMLSEQRKQEIKDDLDRMTINMEDINTDKDSQE